MKRNEILRELRDCDKLKCQGCKLNIKVLHGFDCAAHIYYIDAWKNHLYNILDNNKKYSKYCAFLNALELHEKNKADCNLCPLYDTKYNKCELENFQKRQTLLRTMREEEVTDETQNSGGESSRTNMPE